jgi:hypothetical protein
LEPGEFSEPVKQLTELINKLESLALDAIRNKSKDAKTEFGLAESFSLIPDIGLDLKTFEDASNFLENAIYSGIRSFLGDAGKEHNDRARTWRVIETKLAKERTKMDLQHMEGKKISPKTLNFIKKFMTEKAVTFESLDGKTVEELKDKFPELSKKMKVSIIE